LILKAHSFEWALHFLYILFSAESIDLVKEFVQKLEDIPIHDAVLFPYDTIDELKKDYLGIDSAYIIIPLSWIRKKL